MNLNQWNFLFIIINNLLLSFKNEMIINYVYFCQKK